MMRGGPALVTTAAPGTFTVDPGLPKLTVLKTLKASPRNCSLNRSEKLKVLNKPGSNENTRSMRKIFRPELPKVRICPPVPGRTGGATKQLTSYHRLGVGSDNFPLQTRSGSIEPKPVLVTSPVKVGVYGYPD